MSTYWVAISVLGYRANSGMSFKAVWVSLRLWFTDALGISPAPLFHRVPLMHVEAHACTHRQRFPTPKAALQVLCQGWSKIISNIIALALNNCSYSGCKNNANISSLFNEEAEIPEALSDDGMALFSEPRCHLRLAYPVIYGRPANVSQSKPGLTWGVSVPFAHWS